MNVDNREYIFRVLNDVTKLPFLAEERRVTWGPVALDQGVQIRNSRSQKVGTGPSSDPKTKERRKPGINRPK